MISDDDKAIICELAEKYGVERIVLFGSSLDSSRQARDIDLGVRGVEPKQFFKLYGDLIFAVSKPVDLVDLSRKSSVSSHAIETGVPIYGQ